MNILFLSELFYPHGGGAELATYLYAKLLSKRGFKIIVVTNRFDREPSASKNQNLTVYRLPIFKEAKGIKYTTLLRMDILLSSLIKKLLKWADVIYIPRFWYSAVLLAKAYKKPVVIHLHDYIPICPLSNLFDETKNATCSGKKFFCPQKCIYVYEKASDKSFFEVLESMLFNSTLGQFFSKIIGLSDAVVCVSQAQRNLILKNNAFLSSKIHVIYNPLPKITMASLKIYGKDFGYFGGPSYMKGFHVLCKAAALVKTVKQIKIHATKFSGDNRQNVFLNQLGIVTYGKLKHNEYEALYRQINTVIVPSVWEEPLPYVVSEALMSGRIVIASRVGGIPEQVAGCDGAFLFNTGNYEQLAERILYVENLRQGDRYELGFKNKECVRKRFDNKKITDNFINVIMRVAK